MTIVWLAWYICAVLSVLTLLALAITYAPDSQFLGAVLPLVFGGGALVAGGFAIGFKRFPPTHRVHQSKPVWAACVAVAIAVTLLLILAG
jgi:hypothetical protein